MKILILIFFILVQLAFALLPIIPGLKTLLPKEPNQREQLEWQLEFIGFSFAVLTAYIGLNAILEDNDRKNFQKALLRSLPNIKLQPLRDDEFYSHFLASAKMANSDVNIMYLSPDPPNDTHNADRIAYYADILNAIRRKRDVRFNRIVRITPRTKQWISELLRALSGCPNAYVAALKEHDSAQNPLSLSTQIIDQEKVWLVALRSHERQGPYRDLYIESELFAEALRMYYDRLWTRGDELMNAGRLTPAGQRFLDQN